MPLTAARDGHAALDPETGMLRRPGPAPARKTAQWITIHSGA